MAPSDDIPLLGGIWDAEIRRITVKRVAGAALRGTSCCTDVMSFCRQVVPKLPTCFGFGKTLTPRFLGVEHNALISAASAVGGPLIPQSTNVMILNFGRRNDMTSETPPPAAIAEPSPPHPDPPSPAPEGQ